MKPFPGKADAVEKYFQKGIRIAHMQVHHKNCQQIGTRPFGVRYGSFLQVRFGEYEAGIRVLPVLISFHLFRF